MTDEKDRSYRDEKEPTPDIREEAGPHQDREAIGERAAQTPTRGEAQAESDREQPVQPASEER
ncbi:MAG: hypothetical protein WBV82_02765 [Myxococcaceae bacterium]